ncbi:methyltransferase domain-containing protein [Paenibacillus taihuensis]|uniref:methyltransferase domain-containing protein n=1 Tax=Paenibacillus taihuensis TaxID=1156355 RepID=UPI001FE337CE|nr:methyltransferase domain-containing protein [Paenibacillus taihuensis]
MFDFVIARLLFLHIHDPLLAAREIYRVLKPGGKLVIIDVDDGIFGVVHPDLDVLPTVLKKVANHMAKKGGNRHIGRSVPRLLSQAGFTQIDMDTVTKHSDIHGIAGFKRQFDSKRFAAFFHSGIITEQEYERMSSASEQLFNDTESYAMMLFVMAYGQKPKFEVTGE